MTPQDGLMAVFRGEKPDVMPWFVDMIYWYDAHLHWGSLPERYRGSKGYVQLCKDLGCGTYGGLLSLPADVKYGNVKITVFYEGLSPSGERIRSNKWSFKSGLNVKYTRCDTPVGTLTSVHRYIPSSHTWVCVKYPVEDEEGLKILRYIYRQVDFKPNYSTQYKQLEEWKGYGAVSSYPQRIPFARLLVDWCGASNTYRLLLRSREELEETLDVMSEADDIVYDIVAEAPAPFVIFGDNITSELVSPPIFKRYYAPYYKKRVGKLRAKGKYTYVHVDGTLRGVLPLIEETGIDAAESLTPAPVGDVQVEDLRKIAGPRLILWGGVPAVFFSPVYPEEQLMSMVERVIERYKEDGRFVIGSCDQPPPESDLERIRKVSRLIEKYGSYL